MPPHPGISYVHMYRRGYETLSFRSSKFRNYDPLTTTRVHTQFKLHRQLRVDHAVVVNTGSRHVYALNRSCSCGKCENMEGIRNSRFTRAVLLTFAINSDTFQDETYFVLPSNIIRVIMQRRELAEEESQRARFQAQADVLPYFLSLSAFFVLRPVHFPPAKCQ